MHRRRSLLLLTLALVVLTNVAAATPEREIQTESTPLAFWGSAAVALIAIAVLVAWYVRTRVDREE